MSPTVAELMQALPEVDAADEALSTLPDSLRKSSMQPVPMGRLRRMTLLGSLQAKIAAAYAFFTMVAFWPQMAGQLLYWKDQLRKRPSRFVEYKT